MNKIVISLLFVSQFSLASMKNEKMKSCFSTREFVTAYEYLRSQKDFNLKESSIFNIADHISKGCTGSSQRFIKVNSLLTKVGIDTASSIKSARKFSGATDLETNAFIELFKQTYQKDLLDLDALTSLKISLKLSVDYEGHSDQALSDFKEIASYCKDELDLAYSLCANLSTEVATLGKDFDQSIAPSFISLVKFLSEQKNGPGASKNQAIKIAKSILTHGPVSQENYIQAYRFATSKDGLSLSQKAAMEFSLKMAQRSNSKALESKK